MEVLRWTAEDLQQRGSGSPRLDAEVLLAHVLEIDRVGLYLAHDRPLDAGERTRYRRSIERRRLGEPVAYITGIKEFYSLPLAVDARVLVPRPETELLVEEAIRALGLAREGGRMLDVGTGSGAIAVAILRECPALLADATDVSADALAVAEHNALRHAVGSRLRLLQGTLDEPVAAEPPYDLVVANLPYIPSAEIAGLPASVRDFEPRGALDGGPDGLVLVRRLVARAPALLAPAASMLLEVGMGQAATVAAEAAASPELEPARIVPDYAGIDRVVVLRRR
jgi:release factor glutamine methyltransferase